MAATKKSSLGNDEKLFLVIVVALGIIAASGSWLAATALSRHDKPGGILPDKPRQLVEFSLTDPTGRTVTRAFAVRGGTGRILTLSLPQPANGG